MSGSVGIARDRAPLLGAEHPDSGLRRRLGRALSREPFAVLVLALDALILTALLPFVVGSDSWLALVGGREVAHDWLPEHDTLTIWPHGATWVDQQWLGQLVMYGLHAAGGFRLLGVVHVVVIVVVFWLLATDARMPSRRVFLVLPILALWANVHGSAVLGAGLVVLWGVAGV